MTASRTKIDWLAFRTQGTLGATESALRGVFGAAGDCLRILPRKSGWQGYEQSAELLMGDMSLGMMAYGGEKQRGWSYVGISGRGCDWVQDWDAAQESLEALPAYETRRVDIALTTGRREVTHESVVEAYRAGMFNAPGAGRPPIMTRIESERPQDGSTCYVGSRERDKFLRGYEWGLKNYGGTKVSHIDGFAIEDMYRLELELKPKTCPLPTDLIDQRDQYFAGAYPYLQHVLSDVEPEVMVIRRERGPQADLAKFLASVSNQYGRGLYTALVAHHGDIGAVWAKIVGKGHSEALLRAGVLLVDHD